MFSASRSWGRATLVAAMLALPAVRVAPPATGAEKDKAASEAMLPLKRVVMFSSGVAFYERRGQVEGDGEIRLQFRTENINDLLKSMVLEDAGGRIAAVSYGSKDPITRTLRTFAVDLTSNPTLADLLAQLRGHKVSLDAPNKIEGTIVGVEHRTQELAQDNTMKVAYLTLLTEDGLRSVALTEVGRIQLADPKLDAELRKALTVLAQSHSTDKKSVTLKFTGQGVRPVRVGYIQESPIWKTSYRLVVKEKGAALMQGWAIVENTSEEDWENVQLSLISGRPISFVMDLYQPLYLARPVVEPELYASLRPQTYDQDLYAREKEFRKAAEHANRAPAGELAKRRGRYRDEANYAGKGASRPGGLVEQQRKLESLDISRGVQSVAQAADVGEMFRYEIATPVTIARRRSAMLPIVNESIKCEKLSIYNRATHAKHPLNGLRLKNTTELHLMQGPITVFDGGSYAGDARINDLQPGTERLVSYAMDLDTEVAPETTNEPEEILSVAIVKGTLRVTRKYRRATTYVVKNSGGKAKTVLIEQPIDTAWKLIEPEKPTEKTRSLYRFAVTAEPGTPTKLVVREERIVHQSWALTNLDDNSIRHYLKLDKSSDKVKAALAEVIRRKQEIAEVVARRQELERQIQVIFQEQNRIRQNMAALEKNSDLYRRYIKKFDDQESSIEQYRKDAAAARAKELEMRKALDAYLQGLNLS